MKITDKDLTKFVNELDKQIKEYKEAHAPKKRDWKTYEEDLLDRLKYAFGELDELINEACSSIQQIRHETRGVKSKLTLEQKVKIILMHHFVNKSNRLMSVLLFLFSTLNGISVSYKIVERLYSDDLVILALMNMHRLMIEKKEIEKVHVSGDGTGYTLIISEHYCTYAQKLKDKAKRKKKRTKLVYSFTFMDLDSPLYIGYGTSFRSEKEAYDSAVTMAAQSGILIESVRLDKYYSGKNVVRKLYQALKCKAVYVLPKKNVTVGGGAKWNDILERLLANPTLFLKEYFKRNQSESGFSEDKRRIRHRYSQKRYDRLETAHILTCLWHNLFWLR